MTWISLRLCLCLNTWLNFDNIMFVFRIYINYYFNIHVIFKSHTPPYTQGLAHERICLQNDTQDSEGTTKLRIIPVWNINTYLITFRAVTFEKAFTNRRCGFYLHMSVWTTGIGTKSWKYQQCRFYLFMLLSFLNRGARSSIVHVH